MQADTQTQIARLLVTLGRKCSRSNVSDFLAGTINLLPVAVNVKGKASWDTSFHHADPSHRLLAHKLPTVQLPTVPEHLSLPDCNQAALYNCPSCQKHEPSHQKSFQVVDLGRKVTCGSCKRSSLVQLWWCSCNSLWHVCNLHAAMCAVSPPSVYARKSPSIAKDSSRKRKSHLLEMGIFQDILDDDLRYHATKVKQGGQVDHDEVI